MKIKKLEVDGFRSLQEFSISFEEDITVLVGENDSGKSSLLDCLEIVTQNRSVDIDDFNHDTNTIRLSVEIENFIFEKVFEKDEDDDITALPMEAKPSSSFLQKSKTTLQAENFDIKSPNNENKIKSIAKVFGLTVRVNSIIENLRSLVLEEIDKYIEDPTLKIEGAQFPVVK